MASSFKNSRDLVLGERYSVLKSTVHSVKNSPFLMDVVKLLEDEMSPHLGNVKSSFGLLKGSKYYNDCAKLEPFQLLIDDEGSIKGFCLGEFDVFYISEKSRNRGLGKWFAWNIMKNMNKPARLDIVCSPKETFRFWKKLGFYKTGEDCDYVYAYVYLGRLCSD